MSNETRNERLAGLVKDLRRRAMFNKSRIHNSLEWEAVGFEQRRIADELESALATEPVAEPHGGVLEELRKIVAWADSKTPCASHYECLLGDLKGLLAAEPVAQPQGAIGAATEQEEQAKQAAIHAAQLLAYTAELPADIEAAKELIRKVSE